MSDAPIRNQAVASRCARWRRRSSPVVRRALAIVAAACLGWASVVDSPVVCPDEQGERGDANHAHGASPGSHCCVTAPCHTPTVFTRVVAIPAVLASVVATASTTAPRALASIDSRAPPTPPPTAVD